MKLVAILDAGKLICGDKTFKITCDVRNELNERRANNEVVYTTPADGTAPKAFMPRPFPTGSWRIKAPLRSVNPVYAPWKIPTTARQTVFVWEEKNGQYTRATEMTQIDAFYHLHFSVNSKTTLGCIRLNSAADAEEISSLVRERIARGEKVWLEVTNIK